MRCAWIALCLATLLLPTVARAQSHVSCVGDSITAGNGTSGPSKRYPSVLQTLLGGSYAVENDGFSGATLLKTGDIPYWSTGQYTSSTTWAGAGGDVVIQLGTNDSKPVNWGGKANFRTDCESLVDHYRAASSSVRVWINLIPPATASACCTISSTVIENEIIPLLTQCAANKGATTIDVHAALAPHTNWMSDGVHPNDAGAALIAQTVYDAITKLPTISLAVSATETVAPTSITLTATPAAAYGKVEKVTFREGANVLQEVTSAPWAITVANVGEGTHSYIAQVTESAGRFATSTAMAIDIDAPPPPPPPPPVDASTPGDTDSDASSSSGAPPGTSSPAGTAAGPAPDAPTAAGNLPAQQGASSGCVASPRTRNGASFAVALTAALAVMLRRRRRAH